MYMLKSKEGGDAGTGKLYLGTTKFTSCVSHFFLSFALGIRSAEHRKEDPVLR